MKWTLDDVIGIVVFGIAFVTLPFMLAILAGVTK